MRPILALCAAAMALAACTTSSDVLDIGNVATYPASIAAPADQVMVRSPRFGDAKPHPWDGRAPWTYQVHGTDVSRYQTNVDWRAARAAGISFAFIKATEGGDMIDPMFQEHWNGAKAAGMPRSAYHFFYFCRPAREQAEWFIRNVPRDPSAMPHVLDMEWNHLSPTCRLRPPAATVQAEMRIFLDMLTRHYGKRPIIYTTVDFYEHNDLRSFHGYDWWLRSVAAHPDKRYDSRPFRFWQYTGTGLVPGIPGNADINVFNGTAGEWRQWLQTNTQ